MHTYTLNPIDFLSALSWPRPVSYKLPELSKFLFTMARQPPTTIHILPQELLEQIFTHYTYDDDDDDDSHSSGTNTRTQPTISTQSISAHPLRYVNPLVLGHVCSQWMSISRNLQSLWTRIYITQPESTKQIKMATYWLSLSGTSPLTLSLTMSPVPASHTAPLSAMARKSEERSRADAARGYVDLFFAHYAQWQSVSIRLSRTNYLPSLLSSDRVARHMLKAPPKLKHLDIDYGSWMKSDRMKPDDAILTVLYSAPGLESVAWNAQWYAPTKLVTQEAFPYWKDLKKLTYRQGYSYNALKVADAVALLAACPQLEQFDALFHPEHGHGGAHDVLETVTHRHLRVLHLTIMQATASALFNALCLPALEEVKIVFESGYGAVMDSATPFVGLLERSECALKRLCFDNSRGGADDNTLFEALRSPHLQHLKVLQLAGSRVSHVMNLLTRREDVQETLAILPNLERLEFQRLACGNPPSIEEVEDMLVSRTKKGEAMIVRGVDDKEGAVQRFSALRHVELQLGALGVWGYYRLARLGNWENKIVLTHTGTRSDGCVSPTVQVFSGVWDWIVPETRFWWEN